MSREEEVVMRCRSLDLSVYVITDRHLVGERSLVDVVRAAIQGGATVIQLREKMASTREMIELGRALLTVTRPARVPLIVNDRVDVALAIDADGVHVGQTDIPAAVARRMLGPDRILGVSAETVDQARAAERDGADYLGVGDVYGTTTKPDAGPPIGLKGLQEVAAAVSIPVVGIGGITPENAAAVIEAGAAGVAVVSAVMAAADPETATRRLARAVEQARAGGRPARESNFGIMAGELLRRIRTTHPLIHHITNMVVMNDTANVTLHVGALPVMAHATEEVAEMVQLASALVLNPGTLTPSWVDAMLIAGRTANARGIPVVLDPVGAGATTLRTRTNLRLLQELDIAIIRGNAGEIGALTGVGGEVKGVESVGGPADRVQVARDAARAWRCVVAITGRQDVLSDGRRTLVVDNGHPWLTTLTGTGCMATTVIAAFAAVADDPLVAAACALAYYGYAAQCAATHAHGPASFKSALFDTLFRLTPTELAKGVRVREVGKGDVTGEDDKPEGGSK